MPLQLNSPGWRIRSASRGARTPDDTLPGLPPYFLTDDSRVAEEVVLDQAPATRGLPASGGALDLSCDVEPGRAAILVVRYPSGALTFHPPVHSTSRGLRGPSQARFQVAIRASGSGTTRGLVSKAVKAIVVKVAQLAGDKLVSLILPKLVEAFEKNSWKKKGLKEGWLRVTKDALAAGKLTAGAPVSPERSLLLIHGTFSNAASAYRALASSDFFERVKDTYGDRIFAFDHFSLSRTPEENARMLLDGLPEWTTTFDVITHSRGGLVLRTLVERASAFGPLAQRIKLGRAVLVASPNEGTPLATPERWRDTVGWIANLLELFPDNPFTTGAEFVANGLVWLANHASGDIRGLHAMDGRGEPIAQIQSPPGPDPDAYSALVANYNPTGKVLERLLDVGVDQFFGSANDLVVPSAGGWQVDRSSTVFIPAARIGCFGPGGNLPEDSVTHVSFFSHPETVDFLVNALEGRRQPLNGVDPRKPLPDRRLVRGAAATAAGVSVAARTAPPATARRAPGAAGEPVELHVSVMNGNLTLEPDPLLLGHYASTRLTGTEGAMNELIGGTMARSVRIGLYPQSVGSHQIFINDHIYKEGSAIIPRPAAVIVVGLGPEGQLRPGDLVTAVRLAVIGWARRSVERGSKVRTQQFFSLASTLIGSGGTGVSAGQAAGLITRGVLEANKLLREDHEAEPQKGRGWPRCSHLRLIELYLDRATEAWRALHLQHDDRAAAFHLDDWVQPGAGGLSRPPDSGYRGAGYDFITVETRMQKNGEPVLEYTLDTKRARSEVRGQRTQSRLLKKLVATASSDQNGDQRIGRTLFSLLIPVEIEPYLAGSGATQMALDPETAAIPWELLDVNRAEDVDHLPWALRVKLLRKLRLETFRERVVDTSADDFVLVIGEPACPPEYPRLDGARTEARAVNESLTGPDALDRTKVTLLCSPDPSQLGPDAASVINTLFEKKWRIIHIAGHGAPAANGKPSGVVLSNGTFLGPDEIRSMRAVPELVFVNCCYLAQGDKQQLLAPYDRARFASGVAGALIEIGVRCVIAAGWAVDDSAASAFAAAFYAALLQGVRFIDAVGTGRKVAYDLNPDSNTWAAYQCYGDADWQFHAEAADPNQAGGTQHEDFAWVASARGLCLELERIEVETASQSGKAATHLSELHKLEKSFGARWGSIGEVAERFGVAFFEAGATESALHWLERAANAPDGTAAMRAAEQLANARSRFAWETVEKALHHRDQMARQRDELAGRLKKTTPKAKAAARSALADAQTRLDNTVKAAHALLDSALLELGKLTALKSTMERESLIGSAHKRRAMVDTASGQEARARRDLVAMRRAYAKALRVGRTEQGADLYYPASNCLAADAAVAAGKNARTTLDKDILEVVRKALEEKSGDKADFWSVVGSIEVDQYEAMAARGLGKKGTQEKLKKRYVDLHRRVTSARKWASVYDNACLVLGHYASSRSARERKAAQGLLDTIRGIAHSQGEQ